MAQIRFANNVSTQLTKPVAADDSTIEVRSLTHGLVWPNISATGDYFLIVIDDVESSYWEILKCTKVSIADNITTLTVERGLEGTVPSEFQAGSVVENRLTAGTLDAFGAGFPTKVEINRGGTGATTAADARTNLDVPSKADLSSEVNTRTSEVARLDQKIIDSIPPVATTAVRGTVILSSAIDSVSETMAATPKAVKAAYDDLNNKILSIPDADNKTIIEKDGKVITQDVAIAGDIADLASFRGQIGNARDITKYFPTNDLDDAKKSGFWYYSTQCLNTPGDVKTSGIVHVLQYGGMTYQYAYTYYPQNIYVRSFSSERWNDWCKIILSNNTATLSTQGITQLNSAVNSVSETLAATPKAVKTAYDKAVAAAAKSASADKLATPRSISLTGPVTGIVDFDGSADVSIATTVVDATTSAKGIVQLSSAINSASEATAATSKAVKTIADNLNVMANVPIGGIIAFSGTFGGTDNRYPIPLGGTTADTNWCICDGVTTNSKEVPDLRGRMIIGVSSAYTLGDTGGAATHSHTLSGSVSPTTLTVAQLARHTHTFGKGTYGSSAEAKGNESSTQSTHATGDSKPHTHDLDGTAASADNLPPYYALAFIMRVA